MDNTAVHFVGFKTEDQRFVNAAQVFGQPDFVHRRWDVRAFQEVAPGDVVVFAAGNEFATPSHPSFNDSEHV